MHKRGVILATAASAAATDLQWKIPTFDFHASFTFTTPAHQNSWGTVEFNLTNNLVPYKTFCKAQSNLLSDFFVGFPAYACTPPDEAPLGAAANFKFSRATGKLDVEETVVLGSGERALIAGSVNVTLACTDKTAVNDKWVLGQVYSQRDVKCLVPDVIFSGKD